MPPPFSEHRLDNGLTLIFESIPRIHSAALGFLVNTGSRDEPRELAGDATLEPHQVLLVISDNLYFDRRVTVHDRGEYIELYAVEPLQENEVRQQRGQAGDCRVV